MTATSLTAIVAIYLLLAAFLVYFAVRFSTRPIRFSGRYNHDDSRAALMPLHYLKPEPRRVGDLVVGETGYVSWASVVVNLQGRSFVAIDDRIEDKASPFRVKVQREADGVVLTFQEGSEDTFHYVPRALYHSIEYLPVTSIVVVPRGDDR